MTLLKMYINAWTFCVSTSMMNCRRRAAGVRMTDLRVFCITLLCSIIQDFEIIKRSCTRESGVNLFSLHLNSDRIDFPNRSNYKRAVRIRNNTVILFRASELVFLDRFFRFPRTVVLCAVKHNNHYLTYYVPRYNGRIARGILKNARLMSISFFGSSKLDTEKKIKLAVDVKTKLIQNCKRS